MTASNRLHYIFLVAHYRLNYQIDAACRSFARGLSDLVPLNVLQLFDQHELRTVISGAQVPIDLVDLEANTHYSGEYHRDHPTIRAFWKSLQAFDDLQRRQFLKFVTSCSRPPLLGFKELQPSFCVHSVPEEDRLPTSSTCINLLKLPVVRDERILREKLLYAIEANAGFDLS